MTWSTRRVFITGASGFIGRHVVEALVARGAAVVALTRTRGTVNRPGVREVVDSVTELAFSPRVIMHERIDTVLHLAAQVKPAEPEVFWESNVRGTWSLLEACRAAPSIERIVLVSSIRAEQPERRDPYAVSKRCADLIADCYAATCHLPLRVVALPPVYGPDGRFPQPLVGEHWTWMHIADAVAMILRAAETIPATTATRSEA